MQKTKYGYYDFYDYSNCYDFHDYTNYDYDYDYHYDYDSNFIIYDYNSNFMIYGYDYAFVGETRYVSPSLAAAKSSVLLLLLYL